MDYEDALKLWGASKLADQAKAHGNRKERIIDIDTVHVQIEFQEAYADYSFDYDASCSVVVRGVGYRADDLDKKTPTPYFYEIESSSFVFATFLKEVLSFATTANAKKLLAAKKKLSLLLNLFLLRQSVTDGTDR